MLKALFQKPRRMYYGWRVVAAGCIINAIGSAIHSYGFSVLFLPISTELGLSRAATSLVVSLSRAEGAFEGLLSGWLMDRYGVRPLMLAGAIMAGAGYILLSQVNSFTTFLLVYLVLISLGAQAGFIMAVLQAVNTWFIRLRGLAMSIAQTAFPAGGALLVPLFSLTVYHVGWRPAVVFVGFAMLMILIPVSLVVRRSPESMGLRPDGDTAERAAAPPPRHAAVSGAEFTVKEALRTSSFWVLLVTTGIRLFALGPIFIHFVPMLVWKGMEPQQAAYIMGTMLFFTAPARIIVGWLGDRWSKPKLIGLGLWLGIAGLLLLLYGQATWVLVMGAVLFGLMEGFPQLNWAIVGDFFGRRNFGTIRGLINFFTAWGGMAAPFLAGLIYDRTQSYSLVLMYSTILFAVSSIGYLVMWPPRRPGGA